jgi:hypothetical protein
MGKLVFQTTSKLETGHLWIAHDISSYVAHGTQNFETCLKTNLDLVGLCKNSSLHCTTIYPDMLNFRGVDSRPSPA